jgi:hypothetical protein
MRNGGQAGKIPGGPGISLFQLPGSGIRGKSRGVGNILVESALDMGDKLKIDKYFAWVDPGNKPAVMLLRKFGFTSESLMLEKKYE